MDEWMHGWMDGWMDEALHMAILTTIITTIISFFKGIARLRTPTWEVNQHRKTHSFFRFWTICFVGKRYSVSYVGLPAKKFHSNPGWAEPAEHHCATGMRRPLRGWWVEWSIVLCFRMGGISIYIPYILLLMEEIQHLGCIRPCNKVIFTISTGAGLFPSTAHRTSAVTPKVALALL